MSNYNKILEAVNRGIKFALSDLEDDEELSSISKQKQSQIIDNNLTKALLELKQKETVDLGLPSGTLWCKYNLDVESNQLSKAENWYGKYYAWGELEANKPEFSWSTYKFGDYNKLSKYCNNPKHGLNGFTDNLTELLPEDDVAYQNKKLHNFKFHIPTKEQCEELLYNTTQTWETNYNNIEGLNGLKFTGTNGNQIFIPAAGSISSDNYSGPGIHNIGSLCNLWSSSLYLAVSYRAYYLFFNSDHISVYADYRCIGYSVRPVINL